MLWLHSFGTLMERVELTYLLMPTVVLPNTVDMNPESLDQSVHSPPIKNGKWTNFTAPLLFMSAKTWNIPVFLLLLQCSNNVCFVYCSHESFLTKAKLLRRCFCFTCDHNVQCSHSILHCLTDFWVIDRQDTTFGGICKCGFYMYYF